VDDEVRRLVIRHEQRPVILGVDPRLILVFETNALSIPKTSGQPTCASSTPRLDKR
jgi:hypothetical protein